MAASIDGRIVVDDWPPSVAASVRREYDELHSTFGAQGWMCGRTTMEPLAKRVRPDAEVAREYSGAKPRADFQAQGGFKSFAFALDSRGRLAWESNDIGGDHVVTILSERVSDEYLKFLRGREVSYLLAGATDIDLDMALEKVGSVFGVRTLMLEGGGRINGTMLRAGLIDEVSLLVAPVADGRMGRASLFDADSDPGRRTPGQPATQLTLTSAEKRGDNLLWLRYEWRHRQTLRERE